MQTNRKKYCVVHFNCSLSSPEEGLLSSFDAGLIDLLLGFTGLSVGVLSFATVAIPVMAWLVVTLVSIKFMVESVVELKSVEVSIQGSVVSPVLKVCVLLSSISALKKTTN